MEAWLNSQMVDGMAYKESPFQVLSCFREFDLYLLLAMVLIRVRVHPRGLGVFAQRKVHALRKSVDKKGKKQSWEKIAKQVKNLQGETPCWKVCRDAVQAMDAKDATSK